MLITPVGKLRNREGCAPGHRKWSAGSQPPRAPQKPPRHSQRRAHTGLGPILLLLRSVPQNLTPGVPSGHPLLAGAPRQLLPPGRCQRRPPGSSEILGGPGASGTELRAAGKKNPRHELCREKERGGLSSSWGGGGGSPPKASPGRVGSHRPPRRWVPVCPGPPRGALPPQRSPLWSGAGPFRVSSDISRDGIQGTEPRG